MWDNKTTFVQVPARVYMDPPFDSLDVEFDAVLWLDQGDHFFMCELAQNGWGGCYEADEVALWMTAVDEKVGKLFVAHDAINALLDGTAGFECHIDGDSAMAWLREHRPATARQLESL